MRGLAADRPRILRARRVAVAAMVTSAVLCGSAKATPLQGSSIPMPVSPADGAQVTAGTLPTFVIQRQRGPGGSNYGGRYDGSFDIYGINVSADPTVLPSGIIQSERTGQAS